MYMAAIADPMIPSMTRPVLFATEAKIMAAVVLIALVAPSLFKQMFARIEKVFGNLARRRGLAVLFVALVSLAARAALLPWLPIPVPGVHDEFSYLLQADTFAHGRLANPTPALSAPFETFHVLLHPSYISKYPPMQGLLLAAGQVLFGHPWFGVWLNVAAMCAAICWMLQGWLPSGWALLGGLLAVVRLGTFSYWANSYWGGAAAAIGGALVLGALPRIVRRFRVKDSLWAALGLAILANSRPYEGFVLVLAVAGVFVFMLVWKPFASFEAIARHVIVPLAICLTVTIAGMTYYNAKTTGRGLVMPYQVYLSQYWVAPALLWQNLPPHPPAYRYKVMPVSSDSEEGPLLPYQQSRTFSGFLQVSFSKLLVIGSFFLGPALAVPLVMLPWIFRDRRVRPLLWISGVLLAGFLGETWFYPHYAAPATALIYAVMLQCMRHLRVWTLRRRPTGLMVARLIPVVCLVMLGLRLNADFSPGWTWYGEWPGNIARAQMVQQLEKLPGRQLVIVRYSPQHSIDNEWVYNSADMESSKIIWARDEDENSNRDLLRHFPDRTAWLVEPDQSATAVLRYSPSTETEIAGDASPKR
jgi:hypothetical protein